jgi:hypothetical protein
MFVLAAIFFIMIILDLAYFVLDVKWIKLDIDAWFSRTEHSAQIVNKQGKKKNAL